VPSIDFTLQFYSLLMEASARNVILKKMEPFQYKRYLDGQAGKSVNTDTACYRDAKYHWSEIFYVQIMKGLWLLCLETEEKTDTWYIVQPKTSPTAYFSINYYEARNSFAYRDQDQIKWNKKIIIFSGPSDSYEIMVKKDSPIICYRFVFTGQYLTTIINLSAQFSSLFKVPQVLQGTISGFTRSTYDSESLLLKRIHHILKYERNKFNYLLSLTKAAFEIIDYFFEISFPESAQESITKDDIELMSKVALFLERQIQSKFPGIISIADHFNISPTKLKVLFKKVYNVTPLIYFRNLQMKYASEILSRKERTIDEVSRTLGFKKPGTFSIWLKRYATKNLHKL